MTGHGPGEEIVAIRRELWWTQVLVGVCLVTTSVAFGEILVLIWWVGV